MKQFILIAISLILLGCTETENNSNERIQSELKTNLSDKIDFIKHHDTWLELPTRSNTYKDLTTIENLINDSLTEVNDSIFLSLQKLRLKDSLDLDFINNLDKSQLNKLTLYTHLNTIIDKIHHVSLEEHYIVNDIVPLVISKESTNKDSIDVQVISSIQTTWLPAVEYTMGNFSEIELENMITDNNYDDLKKIQSDNHIDIQGSTINLITVSKADLKNKNLYGVFIYPHKDIGEDRCQIFQINK